MYIANLRGLEFLYIFNYRGRVGGKSYKGWVGMGLCRIDPKEIQREFGVLFGLPLGTIDESS